MEETIAAVKSILVMQEREIATLIQIVRPDLSVEVRTVSDLALRPMMIAARFLRNKNSKMHAKCQIKAAGYEAC